MKSSKRKKLGQFFSQHSDYILKGFEMYVVGKNVFDPFGGKGDLLDWAVDNGATSTFGCDIDVSLVTSDIIYNDSLKSIPNHTFLITNPPYLGKNKMKPRQKAEYMIGHDYEDLYMLSIAKIIESDPDEGIIIVPVNFLSAENANKIRSVFFSKYGVHKLRFFAEQVFMDTSYNVIAFYFNRNKNKVFDMHIMPNDTYKKIELDKFFNIKSDIVQKIKSESNTIKCVRLTEADMELEENAGPNVVECFFNDKNDRRTYMISDDFKELLSSNIMMLNCIDTLFVPINIEDIRKHNVICLIGKNTSRNIAYITCKIPIKDQEKLIVLANKLLTQLREDTFSMFLTNFRDGNRKRIGFDFYYKLINYCFRKLKE